MTGSPGFSIMSSDERPSSLLASQDPLDMPGQAMVTFVVLGIGVIYSSIAGLFLRVGIRLRDLSYQIPTQPRSSHLLRKVLLWTSCHTREICENIIQVQFEITTFWVNFWTEKNYNFGCFLNFYQKLFHLDSRARS